MLALALGTALNMVTFAVLYDALFSNQTGLSDNAVQLLTGWGGGMIGLIGAYVGYHAGEGRAGGPPANNDDLDNNDEPNG